MPRFMFLLITLCGLLLISRGNAHAAGQAGRTAADSVLYADSFESESIWSLYEEIVNGDPCYGDGLADIARSDTYRVSGSYGFRVSANARGNNKSNHVIAGHQIYEHGVPGMYRYTLNAYIPADSAEGQTGPEFSVQNTREFTGPDSTFTAGLQYLPNPGTHKRWNIWHNGFWVEFIDMELREGTWYRFELEFDYDRNRYISFSVRGGDADTTIDLTQGTPEIPGGFTIRGENKGFGPALWVTAECENRWTGCTAVTRYTVYYDDISLIMTGAQATPVVTEQQRNFVQEEEFFIASQYPNPFNAGTRVVLQTPKILSFRAAIYSITGKNIRTLRMGTLGEGRHTIEWDGTDDRGIPVSSGIYLLRVDSGAHARAIKMLLIR